MGHRGGDLREQAAHALPDEYRSAQRVRRRSHVFRIVSETQAFQLPMIGSWLVVPQPHRIRLIALRRQICAELLPDVRTHPDAMNSEYRLGRPEISRGPMQRP